MLDTGAHSLLTWVGTKSAYEVIMGWTEEDEKHAYWIARIIRHMADSSTLHALMEHTSNCVLADLACNPCLPLADLKKLLQSVDEITRNNAKVALEVTLANHNLSQRS